MDNDGSKSIFEEIMLVLDKERAQIERMEVALDNFGTEVKELSEQVRRIKFQCQLDKS